MIKYELIKAGIDDQVFRITHAKKVKKKKTSVTLKMYIRCVSFIQTAQLDNDKIWAYLKLISIVSSLG